MRYQVLGSTQILNRRFTDSTLLEGFQVDILGSRVYHKNIEPKKRRKHLALLEFLRKLVFEYFCQAS